MRRSNQLMSRVRNFTRNLVASYLQLGVNVVYSLVSIPLILYWLPKAEFGLWALLVQMIGYLGLVDLGMTSAVARLLVDHKDDRANGNYGSLLKAACMVCAAQAILILLIVAIAAPWLASLMNIPPEHKAVFILLMRMQGVVTAFTFLLRPLNLMLYAHQRMDLQTYNEMFNLMASLGLLVFFLAKGCGILSFIYGNAITAVIGPVFLFWNCRRLGFLPHAGEWGVASRKLFKEVFSYGSQIFLFNLGCQLQFASQTIVVSRALGLEAAAIWAVGTKMFNLLFPLMTRPFGAALPGLYEMAARGERDRLRTRFRSIVQMTVSLGAFLAGSYVLCNGLFVGIWTSGKIVWPVLNDALLAALLFIYSLQTTHCAFVSVNKHFGAMSYVFLGEGCTFILLSLFFGRFLGIPGIIACSILCTLVFSYQYGTRRSCRYFQCRFREIAVDWVRPGIKLAIVYGSLVLLIWFCTAGLAPFWRLVIHSLFVATAGVGLFFRLGFPPEMLVAVQPLLPRAILKLLSVLIRPNRNQVYQF
jgi:O-antigen/teichoic acid export membrane protein